MAKTVYQKSKNSSDFDEYFIKDVDLMNLHLASGDKLLSRVKQEAYYVEQMDFMFKMANTFSLYENVKEIELINEKHAMAMAKGMYTGNFKPLFAATDIPKEVYDCEGGLFWFNEETQEREWDNVWVYDKNSAYLSILKDGYYPDIESGDLGMGIIKEDEIGYEVMGKNVILLDEGEWADVRFKRGYSNKLAKFANDTYAKLGLLKANPEKAAEAAVIKKAIVAAIGMLRNHNIWFYAYIVHSCRYIMEDLIDENTLICNTDSIISIGPRDDLEIGKKLGQFKVEYEAINCYHKRTNYKLYKTEEVFKISFKGKTKAAHTAEMFEDSSAAHEPDYKYVQGTLGDFIYGKKTKKESNE